MDGGERRKERRKEGRAEVVGCRFLMIEDDDIRNAPGGVMSVATANALKVRWPEVCHDGGLSIGQRTGFLMHL